MTGLFWDVKSRFQGGLLGNPKTPGALGLVRLYRSGTRSEKLNGF